MEKRDLAPTREQLFKEKIHLDATQKECEESLNKIEEEKKILLDEQNELEQCKEQFEKEKAEFLFEMKRLKKDISNQRKFLEQEQNLFEQKKKILENGFLKLADDKKRFEQELQVNRMVQRRAEEERQIREYGNVQNFFNGVNNNLTLKKRYKDLIKIFHPDNVCGDHTTIQMINDEYATLKDTYR